MISGRQEFFFLAIWWAGYFFPFFSHKLSITFVLHAIIFFRQALTGNFFSKSPQLVPGPHYYSARPERLGSRGPNEDPGKRRTRGTNQEQANGEEVGGWKRFRIFY